MDQDKGYYAAQPPQYPQQAHPAYGQPVYGEAASYQPQTGYSPAPQGYYAQPTPQANPVIIQQQPPPQNRPADDCCMGCALGLLLENQQFGNYSCCLECWAHESEYI
ncbi:hypothetical protein BGX20_003262 [Mortierella sp. AD010]|nr:hypothetical protein BGX20_003262 [Mortierella sp. AD010]